MFVEMKNMAGNQIGEIELSDGVFAAPINNALMHQALVRQLANARLGTHKTKGRSEVRGGGRKPWRQKGTGRARQGSRRSPNFVGGGTVFGPQPRKYTKQMPRKMRRAALRSALSVKASSEQLLVLDELSMEVPKTKAMIEILHVLDLSEQTVLIVLPEKNSNVQRSASNLLGVKTLQAGYLNIRDLLGYDTILLSKDSVAYIEAWLDVADAQPSSEAAPPEIGVEQTSNDDMDDAVDEMEADVDGSDGSVATAIDEIPEESEEQ